MPSSGTGHPVQELRFFLPNPKPKHNPNCTVPIWGRECPSARTGTKIGRSAGTGPVPKLGDTNMFYVYSTYTNSKVSQSCVMDYKSNYILQTVYITCCSLVVDLWSTCNLWFTCSSLIVQLSRAQIHCPMLSISFFIKCTCDGSNLSTIENVTAISTNQKITVQYFSAMRISTAKHFLASHTKTRMVIVQL